MYLSCLLFEFSCTRLILLNCKKDEVAGIEEITCPFILIKQRKSHLISIQLIRTLISFYLFPEI